MKNNVPSNAIGFFVVVLIPKFQNTSDLSRNNNWGWENLKKKTNNRVGMIIQYSRVG